MVQPPERVIASSRSPLLNQHLFAGLVCDGGRLQSRGHVAHMIVTSPVGELSLFPAAFGPGNLYALSPHELSGLLTAMQSNLEVGFNLAKGWITPATRPSRRGPNEDEGGVVSGPPWHLEARCRVDGTEHRVSPVCPHLGGIVTGTTPTRRGNARCAGRGSRRMARSKKDRPPVI
jgi:hypothetical protein